MPSNSRVVICAAGGGKTTAIVKEAHGDPKSKTVLVTFTRNNEQEIFRKFYEYGPALPAHVEIMTWFTFLLRELARPYRSSVHTHRIDGLSWQEGRSVLRIPESRFSAHYFYKDRDVYSDKLAKFVCACEKRSGGLVMARLRQRFDHIIIDEVQDLAAYDLEILELILKAGIRLSMVGDHRQAILSTNQAKLHEAFRGPKIINKFRQWEKQGLVTVSYDTHTYRCQEHIAALGDSLFPKEPATKSLNQAITGHDGLFIVPLSRAPQYIELFSPQILRLDRRTDCCGHAAMNFGEAKGLGFERVLIFPHGGAKKWLTSGLVKEVEGSAARVYVGITRAFQSVAFVFDGNTALPNFQVYPPT